MRRLFCLLLALLLSGCSYPAPPGEAHGSRVVTAIEVTASVDGQLQHRLYTQEHKMQAVLSYLRLLQPQLRTTIDPETFRTDAFRIILTLSDGSERVYHQLHSDYVQIDGGIWRSIDPSAGATLVRILEELPSDTS